MRMNGRHTDCYATFVGSMYVAKRRGDTGGAGVVKGNIVMPIKVV